MLILRNSWTKFRYKETNWIQYTVYYTLRKLPELILSIAGHNYGKRCWLRWLCNKVRTADKKPETKIGIHTQALTMLNNTFCRCNIHYRDMPEANFNCDTQINFLQNCQDFEVGSLSLLSICWSVQNVSILLNAKYLMTCNGCYVLSWADKQLSPCAHMQIASNAYAWRFFLQWSSRKSSTKLPQLLDIL